MASPNERVPMDVNDVVSLVLLLIVTAAFTAYSIDVFIGMSQMH